MGWLSDLSNDSQDDSEVRGKGGGGSSAGGRQGFFSPAKYKSESKAQVSPMSPTMVPVRELRSRSAKKTTSKLSSEETKRLVELGKTNATKVNSLLDQIGLEMVDNAGNGNCLFLSIARGLGWSSQTHKKLRGKAVEYMVANPGEFKDFIPYSEEEGPEKAWERYIKKMKKNGWGGPHELQALESAMGIKFEIWFATFDDHEVVTNIQVQRHHPVDLGKKTVILWYVANPQNDDAQDLGDHYMALVENGSGRHLNRVSRYAAMTLDEKGSNTGDPSDKADEPTSAIVQTRPDTVTPELKSVVIKTPNSNELRLNLTVDNNREDVVTKGCEPQITDRGESISNEPNSSYPIAGCTGRLTSNQSEVRSVNDLETKGDDGATLGREDSTTTKGYMMDTLVEKTTKPGGVWRGRYSQPSSTAHKPRDASRSPSPSPDKEVAWTSKSVVERSELAKYPPASDHHYGVHPDADRELPLNDVDAPFTMEHPSRHSAIYMEGRKGLTYLRSHNAAEEALKFKKLDKEIRLRLVEESDEEMSNEGTTDSSDEPTEAWIIERVNNGKKMCSMGKKRIKESLSEIEFDIVGDRISNLKDVAKMFRKLKRDTKISLRAIELGIETQPLRDNSKFDPDSAEIDLVGEVRGDGDDRRGWGTIGEHRFLSISTIKRMRGTKFIRFTINGKTRWSIESEKFLPRLMRAVDTWCCARISDVKSNGEAAFDDIEEEIVTEVG